MICKNCGHEIKIVSLGLCDSCLQEIKGKRWEHKTRKGTSIDCLLCSCHNPEPEKEEVKK